MGIVYAMQSKELDDIRLIAIQALHDSLGFIRPHLENGVSIIIILMNSSRKLDPLSLSSCLKIV